MQKVVDKLVKGRGFYCHFATPFFTNQVLRGAVFSERILKTGEISLQNRGKVGRAGQNQELLQPLLT